MKHASLASPRPTTPRRAPLLAGARTVAFAAACACLPAAHAIEVGSPEGFQGNLDTTITYGINVRAGKADPANIGVGNGGTAASVTNDDATLNFKRGHLTSNVIRATSELDISKGSFGIFGRATFARDIVANMDRLNVDSDASDRVGHDARLLDLYVRHNTELGGKTFSWRLGQQVLNWGESMFIQNGMSVVNPIDVSLLRSPGTELREAYIPTPALSASYQVTPRATVEAFALFRADHYRLDPRGTFFSTEDIVSGKLGSDKIYMNAAAGDQRGYDPSLLPDFMGQNGQYWVTRTATRKAERGGQFGLATRWSYPQLNDLEMGLYYMQYTSRVPILSFTVGAGPTSDVLGDNGAGYYVEYPKHIHLVGLSGRWRGPWGTALQGEYSYRPNQPLQLAVTDLTAQAAFGAMALGLNPGDEISGYKRVGMHQLQLAATKVFGPAFGASTSALVAEVGYTHLNLPQGEYFEAPGIYQLSAPLAATLGGALGATLAAQPGGYTSRNSWGYVAYYQLEYNDVLMGAGITPRIAFSHDVRGVGPTFNQGAKSLSLGASLVSASKKWKVDLSYTDYFGGRSYHGGIDPFSGTEYVSSANPLNDRDFIAASVSYAF